MAQTLSFRDIPYTRPVLEELESSFRSLIARFASAESAEGQREALHDITKLRNETETMATLVSIRHSLDTRDEFYDEENNAMDEMLPHYEGLLSEFFQVLSDSPFKKDLSAMFGEHLFSLVDIKLKTFKPEILEDLQLENKLGSEYTKLLSSAKIPFEGEDRNLSQISPFTKSKDRDMRIRAQQAVTAFFMENEAEFDRLYDEMVKIRTIMAKKLGFPSFTALGYARMNRTDYDADMVAGYRDQVLRTVVPVSQKLRTRQAKRLGLDALKYYDEFLSQISDENVRNALEEVQREAKKECEAYVELKEKSKEFSKELQKILVAIYDDKHPIHNALLF